MARLDRYWDGKLAGSVILRQRDYLVGREPDCDVILQDKLASRRHFQILWNDEGYFVLKDLQTSNGTLVDGVKEFNRKLLTNATIQVGQELLQFQAYDSSPEDSDEDNIPAWAMSGGTGGGPDLDATAHMAPSMLQRLQARVRARQRPHLLLHKPNEPAVFPLEAPVTTVGFGPVRASLGPTPDGREKVLAEVHRNADGTFKIRAPGFFGKVEVNGTMKKESPLVGGEKLAFAGLLVEFSMGMNVPR